jgi:carbon storage regulator
MLVLTRRHRESLKIGDTETVIILRVKCNQVCLGVDAPNNIAVHREEVYERIRTTRPCRVAQVMCQEATP